MIYTKNLIKKILTTALLLTALGVDASVIKFTAEGVGNMPNGWVEGSDHSGFTSDPTANFFAIDFIKGNVGEFIEQVSFDLNAGDDQNAYFDPGDGDPSNDLNGGGKGFGPIIGDSTTGLSGADVTFSLNPSSAVSNILTIYFTDNSFGVGDKLSFGIDIDQLDGSQTDIGGGLLGLHSVGVSANIAGHCTQSGATHFVKDTRNRSITELSLCTPYIPVPSPSTFLLFMVSVVPFGLFLTKKTRG